jgi:CRP/FNR family cyclic AMP-dependent transcriptional regulator
MNDPFAALPSLLVLNGLDAGRRMPLTTGAKVVLGRALEAEFTFPDEPTLARHHIRIERADGGYTLVPLDAAAGTWVNERPVTAPVPLAPGDIIRLGAMELRFELPGTPPPTRPAAAGADIGQPRVHAIIPGEARADEPPEGAATTAPAAPAAATPAPDKASATAPEHAARMPPAAGQAVAEVAEAPPAAERAVPHAVDAGVAATVPEEPPPAVPPGAPPPGQAEAAVVPVPADGEREAVPPAVSARAEGQTAPAKEATEGEEKHEATEAAAAPATAAALGDALAGVPLFHSLGPDQRHDLTRMMSERRFPAGREIVRQGEDGLSLYIILEGEVTVVRAVSAAGEVELAHLGPGGFFGEMTLLDGLPRSATVRALTPVRCALLPRWALEDAIRAHPEIALVMLATLSRRLRDVERKLTA